MGSGGYVTLLAAALIAVFRLTFVNSSRDDEGYQTSLGHPTRRTGWLTAGAARAH